MMKNRWISQVPPLGCHSVDVVAGSNVFLSVLPAPLCSHSLALNPMSDD